MRRHKNEEEQERGEIVVENVTKDGTRVAEERFIVSGEVTGMGGARW